VTCYKSEVASPSVGKRDKHT